MRTKTSNALTALLFLNDIVKLIASLVELMKEVL